VVICEGEKAADAAGRFLPGYVAVSWPGGAQSLAKADWSPLAGRTVLLWPDADAPGWQAMQTIAAILADPAGLACTVRILDSNQMSPGWDAADAESEGWSTEELVEWAKPRARDFTPAALQGSQSAAEPTPAADSAPTATVVRLAAVDGHTVTAVDGEEARPLALSESGVALEFVTDHCGDLRYVHEWEAWMKWNGHRWTRETNRQTATQRIQNMCKGIKYRPEARELSTSAKNHFERKAFFFSCLDLAEYDRRLIVTPDMFDANPMQLSTPGGTVDLATGKLCAPDPADYITRSTSVAPVQGPHPLFDQVIKCASSGSADMECFIWRWLGYICTGSVREESFLFLFGKPACGKSTLVECIANILGLPQEAGYATKVPIELFTESKHERSGDAHVLHGARFAFCAETEENRHWKAALLKEATGGDTMTGERKYENVFAFRPSHKIWIHGNHKPHMRTADEGLRRRMHLLEYASDIPEGQRDLHFKDKLAAEYPAILYSMIQSAIEWNEFGLRKPQQIIDTVSEYFTDEDTFGSWWDECVTVASGASCGSTDAFKSYQAFCDERGERAPSHKRFSIMVKNKGHEISKSGTKRILGISLVPASFGPPGDHWSQRD
jgi:putative DNA primase/helicase